jgi:hypothetical protein
MARFGWLSIVAMGLIGAGCHRAAEPATVAPPAKSVAEAKTGAVASKPSLAEQFAEFQRAHQEREKKFYDQLRADRNDDEKISRANTEWQAFARQQADQLIALIKAHRTDLAAFDGILVLVGEIRYPLDEDLVRLVQESFATHPRMGQLCFDLAHRGSEQWPEAILQAASRHPALDVRGQAEYALGDYYLSRALPYSQPLPEEEQAKWLAEAERHYSEVKTRYAAARSPDGKETLSDKAGPELLRIKNLPLLKVGKVAPEIEGEDIDGVKFKLSDYRGKVVMLDFWGHW